MSSFTVDEVPVALAEQVERAKDQEPALNAWGASMILSIDQNFEVEGRRNDAGHQWDALSAVTIAFRPPDQRDDPRILQDTGDLRRSTDWEPSARRCAVGTFDPKAPDHHQNGRWGDVLRKTIHRTVHEHTRVSSKGKKFTVTEYTYTATIDVPARPVYVLQPSDMQRWERIQAVWIRDGKVTGG